MSSDRIIAAPVLAAITVVFSALFSCTVLEDRGLCPCYITFDLSDATSTGPDYLLFSLKGEGGWKYTDTVEVGDGLKEYYVPVPRGRVDVMVMDQNNRGFMEGDGLVASPGLQFPRANMHIRTLDARGEACLDTVRLHKNYCILTVKLVDSEGENWPFSLKLVSDCVGYAMGGGLIQGDFWIESVPDEEGCLQFTIPRQYDDLMRAEVLTRDLVLRSFSIGTVLTAAHYDWNKPDLDDVTMEIDFASAKIALTIDKWSSKQYFNLVI